MSLNQILVLAGAALGAAGAGFLLGTLLVRRRLVRRIGDDAQEWLDSRSAGS